MLSPGSHPVGGKPPATRGPGREPRADSALGILQLLKGTKSVTNLYVRKHEKPISVITYSGYLCKHMTLHNRDRSRENAQWEASVRGEC